VGGRGRGRARSCLDDQLVLAVTDHGAFLQEYEPGNPEQQWRVSRDDNTVRHRDESGRVLDVADHVTDECARVVAWEEHGGDNQRWTAVHLPPRRCLIRSAMHGKVLDVKRGDDDVGTKVVMWEEHGGENQQWYEDRDGVIHTCLGSDLALDTTSEVLRLGEHDPSDYGTQWRRTGVRIANLYNPSQVLDIEQKKDKDGANKVISYEDKCGKDDNQCWDFEYLD